MNKQISVHAKQSNTNNAMQNKCDTMAEAINIASIMQESNNIYDIIYIEVLYKDKPTERYYYNK